MNLPFVFARRYFRSKKSSNAINILSWVSVLGMFVGAFGLILVLSVFNGFQSLVISLFNTFNPDFTVTAVEGKYFTPDSMKLVELNQLQGIRAISPVIEENALLTFNDQQDIATIKGVSPDYGKLTGIDSSMYDGEFMLQGNDSSVYAVLGAGVSSALGINIMDPLSYLTMYIPRSESVLFGPSAIDFNSGVIKPAGSFAIQADFDAKYVFVPIDFLREQTGNAKQVSYFEIAAQKNINLNELQKKIETIFGSGFEVKNRLQQNELLYKVMKSEKWLTFTLLAFILVVATFNIIGSLSILVIEKKKDISIMRAMGASEKLVRNIFLSEGALLSFIGCISGFAVAIILILLQHRFGFLKIPGSSFVIDAYPVQMQWGDFALVFTTVMVIGLLASFFPSWRAARTRYELANE